MFSDLAIIVLEIIIYCLGLSYYRRNTRLLNLLGYHYYILVALLLLLSLLLLALLLLLLLYIFIFLCKHICVKLY